MLKKSARAALMLTMLFAFSGLGNSYAQATFKAKKSCCTTECKTDKKSCDKKCNKCKDKKCKKENLQKKLSKPSKKKCTEKK